jgi:hypothetical protein
METYSKERAKKLVNKLGCGEDLGDYHVILVKGYHFIVTTFSCKYENTIMVSLGACKWKLTVKKGHRN